VNCAAASKEGQTMYDLAVVIPVRRGSSRIADKSMLPFGGAPSLIEWKLRQLSAVIDPARIYLSSEDDEFLGIAASMGATPLRRERWLAVGHGALMRDIIPAVAREVPHEHIAWCTVVCPLMTPGEYLTAFRNYREQVIDGGHDSLLGVNMLKEYFWMGGRALNYEATRDHKFSQDLQPLFKVTNSIYMLSREEMIRREYFIGEHPFLEKLSMLAGIDIDHLIDYRMACALHVIYEEDDLGRVDSAMRIAWDAQMSVAAA
jgi:CMP-N-acetylneuraminic acid synthetase